MQNRNSNFLEIAPVIMERMPHMVFGKQRYLYAVAALFLLVGQVSAFAGGNGTASNPYEISNVDQLQNMSSDLDAHYELVSDINASETRNWNNGSGFKPVPKTPSSFDGNHHTIRNLTVNRPKTENVGLFSEGVWEKTDAVDIGNFTMSNFNISGENYVGAVAGKAAFLDYSSIRLSGYVSGNDYVGGFAGQTMGSASNVSINVSVDSDTGAGGLAGYIESQVERDFEDIRIAGIISAGNTSGCSYSSCVGSVSGYLNADIKDIVATAKINVNDGPIGGLVGHTGSGTEDCIDCYWDTDRTGTENATVEGYFSDSSSINGYSTDGMMTPIKVSGLDLQNAWGFKEEGGYPLLRQFKTGLVSLLPPSIQSVNIEVNESRENPRISFALSSNGDSDIASYQGLSSVSTFTNSSLESDFSFPLKTNVSISDDVGLFSENQELDIRKTDSGHKQDPSCGSLTKQCLNQTVELENLGEDSVDYSLALEIPGTLDSSKSWSGTLNAESAASHTAESHGDWIDEEQYPLNIPEQVTIGENYGATRGLETSEQLGFTWSQISTTGFVDTPSSCTQANQTSISLNAGAAENRTVGFSCSPGGIDTQSFDLVNKTDYEKAWNNISFTVSSNLTEESNITVPVDEANLNKFSERDAGSLKAFVNGETGNISLRDGNGTIYITVEDDFGNSSLHEGGHTAALTYTVGKDDSSGSAPAPIRRPPSGGNQTNYSVEFTTQDYYTVAPGSTSKIYFTVWNYEKEANSVTLQTRDTTACSHFRVQSNFVGDKFSKNTSLKIPGTRDDLGAGGADVILMAKVNLPNRTELQNQGLGDTFTCRFDTGAGIGEARSLNLTVQAVDTTPRWVKGVRQLIPDLPATSLMVREEICLPEGGENASRLEQVQRYLEEGQCSGELYSVPLPTGEASAVIFGAFVFVAGVTKYRGRVI